jgi:hypothetical protein
MDAIFTRPGERLTSWQRIMVTAWLLGILLLGVGMWTYFFRAGDIPWEIHDWPKEWQYYTILKQGMEKGILPLHTTPNANAPERFLAIPETVLSPQIVTLNWIDAGTFVWLNTVFLYGIGFYGLTRLARRYQFSPFVTGVLVLLFNFNGHIVAHMSVGHSMWLGYYILPLVLLQILRLVEGDAGGHWPVVTALILFAIALQGSGHIFVWCLIFIGILFVAARPFRKPLLVTTILALLLNAVRLLPGALQWAERKRTFYAGYINLADILSALTRDVSPYNAVQGRTVGWWELDLYIGVAGLILLLFFGLAPIMRRSHAENGLEGHRTLFIPIGVMAFFSLTFLYQPIHALPIPVVGLERVASRFLALPVLMLIPLTCIYLQRWLASKDHDSVFQFVSLIYFGVMAHDLLRHMRLWRVENLALALPEPDRAFVRDIQIVRQIDPAYAAMLVVGLSITILTLLYSLVALRRMGRQRYMKVRKADPPPA